ncbi:MAG: SixA phosphatase family protein [Gammaproteobacteria bacterium]
MGLCLKYLFIGGERMIRELMLLRHGKSDWSVDSDDFNRPLNKRGKKAALKVGEWLQHQGLVPDWIVSSPALRALNTAERVVKVIGLQSKAINLDMRIYQADVLELKNVLANCPAHTRRVLLVGHNPELEALLLYLAEAVEMPEDGKLMATATLARLRMPEDWNNLELHCAELVSITRVKVM